MAVASTASSVDQLLEDVFQGVLKQWDFYSVLLFSSIVGFMVYGIFTNKEPDIHPMILAHQSSVSRVRKAGESAIYRSPDTPEGLPLRSGLAVRLASDPPYSSGRDGDLRDIWRKVKGEIVPPRTRAPAPPAGKQTISTVLGKLEVIEHSIDDLSKEIDIIGGHLSKLGVKRVAVYLPNSVELLNTVFACSYFGLSVILIPFNQPHPRVVQFLSETKADSLVAAAGSLPLDMITSGCPSIKSVTWVVESTSRHMDWTEVPGGLGGKVDVSVWHELIQDHSGLPPVAPDLKASELGKIIILWQNDTLKPAEAIEFTHANFIAAVSSLLVALPFQERLQPTDLVLPADSLTHAYCLSQTLAALWAGASLALSSVSGPEADLSYATQQISPTVVITSADSAAKLHSESSSAVQSGLAKLAHGAQSSSLAAGNMPSSSILTTMAGNTKAKLGSTPDKLRLVYVAEKAGSTNPPMSSSELSDLRIFTGARVIYALTAAPVAGAVAQTNFYDYRVHPEESRSKHSHFGAPLSSLEIKLVDTDGHKTTDESPQGEITVSGPSVAGGSAKLGIDAKFRPDCTLAYA